MKTIKKNEELQRVSDNKAHLMVSYQGWMYCPKSEWKEYRKSNKKTKLKSKK